MRDSMLEGDIPADGIVSRLSEIEETRATGVLRFSGPGEDGPVDGEVALVRGQISVDQPRRSDGQDAVELLLALRAGGFTVHQQLPELPVSSGDPMTRTGSLAVHVPADLMNYCERGGLTGKLTLSRGGESVIVCYRRGDLDEIRCGGADDDELMNRVFSWDDGTFIIEATTDAELDEPISTVPSAEQSHRDGIAATAERGESTAEHFLRVVEMSLGQLLDERSKAGRKRTGPELPALPKARKTGGFTPKSDDFQLGVSRAADRPDATVKVVYLRSELPPPPEPSPGMLPEADATAPDVDIAAFHAGEVTETAETDETRRTAISAIDDAKLASIRPPAEDVEEPPTKSIRAIKPSEVTKPSATVTPDETMTDTETATQDAPTSANPEAPESNTLETLGWVAVSLLAMTIALVVLANMPNL